MPSTQTASQRPRGGAGKRGARREPVRVAKRAKARQDAAAVAAPSLAALTLAPKCGLEVHNAFADFPIPAELQRRALAELVESYEAAAAHLLGEPIEAGYRQRTVDRAISTVIAQFSQRFSDSYQPAVGFHNNRFCFELRQACNDWGESWNALEAKPLLQTARKISRSMGDLMPAFLKMFIRRSGIYTWYSQDMAWAEDHLEERIYELQNGELGDEDERKECESIVADLNSHRTGAAAHAKALIEASIDLTPDEIMRRLRRMRSTHPLVEAMYRACELLTEPYNIHDFDGSNYFEIQYNDVAPLPYPTQNMMIWEYENALTSLHEEWLNMTFQESGCFLPVAKLVCDPTPGCAWDTDLSAALAWPNRFVDVCTALNDACKPTELLIDVLV